MRQMIHFLSFMVCLTSMMTSLSAFGDEQGLRAAFHQKKWLSGVENPLESKGFFNIYPNQVILWETVTPFQTEMVISANHIQQFVSGRKAMELSLEQLPFLKSIHDLLTRLGSENMQQEIADYYGADLQKNGDGGWLLRIDGGTEEKMPFQEILFKGMDNDLKQVAIARKNGDREEIDLEVFAAIPVNELPILPDILAGEPDAQ